MNRRPSHLRKSRHGIAAVEFAILAPVFLLLVLGIAEMGRAVQTATVLSSAVREGGRLASMDWKDIVEDDDSVNAKVVRDIRNFLNASGLPGDAVDVSIVHADGENEGSEFDLADKNNYLKLCRIEASVPYSSISNYPYNFMVGQSIETAFVFRTGRITEIVE